MRLDFNTESEYEVVGSVRLTKYYESKFINAPSSVEMRDTNGTITFNDESFDFTLDVQDSCELFDDLGKFIGPVDKKINLNTPSMDQLKSQRMQLKSKSESDDSEKKQAILGASNDLVKSKNGKSKLSKIIKSRTLTPAPPELKRETGGTAKIQSSPWMSDHSFPLKDRILHILAINDFTFANIKVMTKAPQQELIKLMKEIAFQKDGLLFEIKKDSWALLQHGWKYSEFELSSVINRLNALIKGAKNSQFYQNVLINFKSLKVNKRKEDLIYPDSKKLKVS